MNTLLNCHACSQPGEGSITHLKRSKSAAAAENASRADRILQDTVPENVQRVLRRRMTNRLSAMRMRNKRQAELDAAQQRVRLEQRNH